MIIVLVEGSHEPSPLKLSEITKELQMEHAIKICTKCKIEKSLDEFFKRNDVKTSHRSHCKQCTKTQKDIYRKQNEEIIKKKQKEWGDKNRTNRLKKKIEYNRRHRKEIRKWHKEYLQTEKGKEKSRVGTANYRAKKRNNSDGTITYKALRWLRKLQNNKCYKCKKPLDFISPRATHLDHHIPISKGGKHSIENVVYLCQFCNLSKSDTIPQTLMLI